MSKKKIRVAIIGTNGIPAMYGGFETLAEYLTKELSNYFKFTVYCSSIYKKEERLRFYNNSKLKYLPIKANGLESIFYDTFSTIHAFFKSDILLILGPAAGFILTLNFFFKKIIITNHGGINEWERKKFSYLQKKYAYLSHKTAALASHQNIADNLVMKEKLYKTFNITSNVIEYGGDHVSIEKVDKKLIKKYPFLSQKYTLSVARAQIDNHLHTLIETYKELPKKNLVIISNWKFSNYGQQLLKKNKNLKNIFLVNAVYNKFDLDVIRSNTELYIHSHSECGTSPSLVEAMNYNIPIICYDAKTNREVTENKTFYFKNNEDLKNLISKLSVKKTLEIKNKMFEIAKRKYTWRKITNKYANLLSSF